MSIKAIVFDIGGILEITEKTDWDKKWEKILDLEEGFIHRKMNDTWAKGSIGTITLEEVHKNLSLLLNIKIEQANQIMNDIWKEYLGSLNKELYDYFKSFKGKYKTAILSNSFVGAREKEQEKYGFESSCDFIIYSHEVGLYKPDLAIYNLLISKLDVLPSEIIFLDDIKENIDAANKLGINGILFEDNKNAIEKINFLLKSDSYLN
ncbi:MAG: HAD family phosphatase [Candidatus Sericytochromatia bacterium]